MLRSLLTPYFLSRCAAYVAITPYFLLLLVGSAGLGLPTVTKNRSESVHTLPLLFTSYLPLPFTMPRGEFVGNRAESEARAVCPDSSPTLVSAEGRHL
jgi:hypothetical protein